jgi:nucleoid-associated protein YgaU
MKKFSLMCILCVLFSACTLSGSKEEVASKPNDELEFAVDTFESSGSTLKVEEQKIVEQKLPDEAEKNSMKPMAEEPKIASHSPEGKEGPMPATEEPQFKNYRKQASVVISPDSNVSELGAEEKYHVQKGETLMMVAFKIYGDYRKWKDLKVWNKDKRIGGGAVIKYYIPEKAFGWQPSGLPYLVKTGDTLGLISMDKYGTSKKWKSIYENNRPLIRDPNLIFAGFTIYYMPVRDIASEHR